LIDVKKLRLGNYREPKSDIGRRVLYKSCGDELCQGVYGRLAGWTKEKVVLKMTELEQETHGFEALYLIVNPEHCLWEWE
jgi:hypothetical protein